MQKLSYHTLQYVYHHYDGCGIDRLFSSLPHLFGILILKFQPGKLLIIVYLLISLCALLFLANEVSLGKIEDQYFSGSVQELAVCDDPVIATELEESPCIEQVSPDQDKHPNHNRYLAVCTDPVTGIDMNESPCNEEEYEKKEDFA